MGKMTKRDKMLEKKARIIQIKLRYYWAKVEAVEEKLKRLHVIDYGDYFKQFRKAHFDYRTKVGEPVELTPYGRDCWEQEIRGLYYSLLENLENEGYCVRW